MRKNIFTYWAQGLDQAPMIVRRCLDTFHEHNPEWSIHCFDSDNIKDWTDPVPIDSGKWRNISLAHRSDLLRTQLLIRHGGVWADPTVWFCKPLDDWLPEVMDAGVFMFHRPGRDRAISNWFIAAEPGNPLLQRQYDALCTYWRENEFDNLERPMSASGRFLKRVLNRNLEFPRLWLKQPFIKLFRTYPYMVYHYMIHDLVRSDPELGAIWERMPKVSADIPHFPAHKGVFEPLDKETKDFIDSRKAPLFKLTWKLPSDSIPEGSVLDYLLSTGPTRVAHNDTGNQ